MGGGGAQQPCRDPTAAVTLMGQEGAWSSHGACPAHHSSHGSFGGSFGTLPVTAQYLIPRALGLNASPSDLCHFSPGTALCVATLLSNPCREPLFSRAKPD